MSYKIARYGWLPDLPDQRDHFYAAPVELAGVLPAKVDLRPQCPPVYDQGQLGSCFTGTTKIPLLNGNVRTLKELRDGAEGETFWVYSTTREGRMVAGKARAVQTRKSQRLYKVVIDNGEIIECTSDHLTPILSQIKGCLASGYPFVFGFTVYESFESAHVARPGHASLPKSGEAAIGGHAVAGVGYDDAKQWFVVRNSWGGKWGMKGYFTLPYAYVTDDNLASDFWTIRVVQ
jgi:hypothetical protein